MTRDPDRTCTMIPVNPDDAALDAGLAAAFGPGPTPGGWSRPPLLRDEPSDDAPLVQPSSSEMPRGGPDRYQLHGEIARGGMGVILKGRDPDLGRDLAFKVLKADLVGRAAAEQRFVEEAQVGGQLQHPGVVPVYDLGRFADGRPYFAMKLVKGRTLAGLLADRASPSADRGKFLQVVLQVCQTIAYAHSRGVVHRDLKPANVMVGAFGEVQVMDWGLAKVLPRGGIADEERATQAGRECGRPEHEPTVIHTARSGGGSGADTVAGSVMGTPAYMPPEQAGGEIDKLDERADVFGLGAVLCVVLTGQPPYVGEDAGAVRLMATRGELADAIARLDACGADAELVALCKGCLAADREARPRHAGAVRDALAAYLADVESRAQGAEVARAAAEARAAEERNTRRVGEEKAAEERKRRRVQTALAAAVGLLAIVGGGFGWHADRQAGAARQRQAEFQAEQARLDGRRRAEQAALDAERRLKADAAREQVTRLLALAAALRTEYRFGPAAAALDEARAAAAAGGPDLVPAVDQARADLGFVRELDGIRGKGSTWIREKGGKGRFDVAGVPPGYRRAFAARGLDVAADPAAAGAGVAGSAVRPELVAALDDWLVLEPDAEVRGRVAACLARADPGSPAAPFRDPAGWADRTRLRTLAAEVSDRDLPPGAGVAIAGSLLRRGLDAAPLLRRAVAAYPRDFGAAFALGQALLARPADADEAIGAFRVARSLRPDNFATLTNLGAKLSDKGDGDGAVACYREAVRVDPTSAQAHTNLGSALSKQGDVEGAIACYREAVRLDPNYATAHNNLGNALDQQGDVPGAVACYREAIRLDPNFLQALNNLGNTLLKQGDVEGAIAACREAVRLDPKLAQARNNLGNALLDKGDVPGAIACYREAIRLDPKLAQAHSNLGNALLDKGDVEAAIACYREAIRLNPNYATARNNLGIALLRRGDVAGAVAAYKEALRLDPKLAPAHIGLGDALLDKEDVEGAIACYREAVRLDPNYAQGHSNLGAALFKKGDVRGAVAAYREALRRDPKLAWAHNNLGNALEEQGDVPGAIACYREAARLDPNYATAHYNLGNALLDKGDVEGAIAALREAIRLDPDLPKALLLLAWARAAGPDGVRDGKEAVRLATRACELSGWKNPSFIDTLAAAHAEAGDFDKAVEYQRKAAALADDKALEADLRSRIGLYERRQPYRDPALARRELGPPPREVKP